MEGCQLPTRSCLVIKTANFPSLSCECIWERGRTNDLGWKYFRFLFSVYLLVRRVGDKHRPPSTPLRSCVTLPMLWLKLCFSFISSLSESCNIIFQTFEPRFFQYSSGGNNGFFLNVTLEFLGYSLSTVKFIHTNLNFVSQWINNALFLPFFFFFF